MSEYQNSDRNHGYSDTFRYPTTSCRNPIPKILSEFMGSDRILLVSFALGRLRGKPKFNLQLWNAYEQVIKDFPRSNNVVKEWHHAFNNRVSIKHPSVTKLAKSILREQSRFEIDTERLRVGEQPKKKKKVYENLDARLKRVVISYDVNNIEEYLTRIAMNLKIST